MIVVNPVQIDYKKLAEVAKRSRGKINRIYLHWTAGHYDDVYDDYHINIGAGGELYLTCEDFTELKAHTWRRNTGSIGIAMCCAAGATLSAEAKQILAKNRRPSSRLKQWRKLWRC